MGHFCTLEKHNILYKNISIFYESCLLLTFILVNEIEMKN